MSSKRQRKWVIRGFDVGYIEDDEYGLDQSISTLNGFTEIVADNVVDMFEKLSTAGLHYMRQSAAIDYQKRHNCVVMNEKPKNEFYTMRIRLSFNCTYEEMRAHKHDVIESIKLWAEKRTAKYNSLSGWRLNAIKDPIFERVGNNCQTVTFDVLLSNVIWYTGNRVTISDKADIPSYALNDVMTLCSLIDHKLPQLKYSYHTHKTHIL